MAPSFLQIILLGLIQGAAELLPVSSSAHVVVAEKLMGLNPSDPEMTFVLVMLHTGTMVAVLAYFWKNWAERYFSSPVRIAQLAKPVIAASIVTAVVYLVLLALIRRLTGIHDVEELFGRLTLIAPALAVVGVLIIIAGKRSANALGGAAAMSLPMAIMIGVAQGVSLPFRGFSRSGSTISTALLLGGGRIPSEDFSFVLAVILTPAAVGQELYRLLKHRAVGPAAPHLAHLVAPGIAGMICSLVAGVLALRLLSRFLTTGRWQMFGYYCLAASVIVFALASAGL